MFIVKYFSQNEILIIYFRHSVKALVKEPAISDGRIRPGDKLISANGQVIVIFKYLLLSSRVTITPTSKKKLLLNSTLIFHEKYLLEFFTRFTLITMIS